MGMVRQWQELLHGGRYSESYSEALPDFVKLAEAYGAPRHPLRRPRRASTTPSCEMIDTPKAVIFDCVVDKHGELFPHDPVGQGAQRDAPRRTLGDDAGIEVGSVIDEKGKMLV